MILFIIYLVGFVITSAGIGYWLEQNGLLDDADVDKIFGYVGVAFVWPLPAILICLTGPILLGAWWYKRKKEREKGKTEK